MPSAADCATLQALFEGVEDARETAEREWGRERLPLLVDDETRAKLRRQQARWSAAYQAAWQAPILTRDLLADVESAAGGMKRAWTRLAEMATEAGHRPIAPWVWEVRLADGTIAALVQTNDEASKVIADGRYAAVYTTAEVANVIDALPNALQMAKVVFPGAKVLPQSPAGPWTKAGDAIPFGDAA